MIEYLVLQIVEGRLTYKKVMTKFAGNKDEIDERLKIKGREDLINEINELKN